MKDVRLLVEVIRQNEGKKEEGKIKLPAGVECTALWWDAKLVNEVRRSMAYRWLAWKGRA